MLADPRRTRDPSRAPAEARELYALAHRSLSATTGQESSKCDAKIVERIDRWLAGACANEIEALFANAAPIDVHRHLWRLFALRAARPRDAEAAVGVRLFAIPLVIVTGRARAGEPVALPAALPDVRALEALLGEHGALGGNRTFSLSASLVASDAIDIGAFPGLLAAAEPCGPIVREPLDLRPSTIHAPAGEAAHVRFLVGTALVARDVDPFVAEDVGRWGMPLSRVIGEALATADVSVLALPRPAMGLPAAVVHGRAAQREVAAQLFASNALRDLRARFGEPVAVLSAHVAPDAPEGGELRLSLSSPLSPRDAQGWRCPLYAGERVDDVAAMLASLLEACRVRDVRIVEGVHVDRDPVTGGPLLFKPDTLPPTVALH